MKQVARLGKILAVTALVLSVLDVAVAGPVTTPNAFTGGTPAVAAEVNANFAAFEAAVNDNDTRIAQLLADNVALVRRLDELVASNQQLSDDLAEARTFIEDLRSVMSLQDDNQGNPAVVFSGVNVQINNGQGATDSINGLGNLVIGYDEPTQNLDRVCSNGLFQSEADCLANNEVFSNIHKSGSHNLVIGERHNYSRVGGLIAGLQNMVIADNSSVPGGEFNVASGPRSTVSGGGGNQATGRATSVSGGGLNVASALRSSVSGGQFNRADGQFSSVSGGRLNTASGDESSISGGGTNVASGAESSVSGGNENVASEFSSSVSGGRFNAATGVASSVTGGQGNTASGGGSSVSGGRSREASDNFDWVAGSLTEDQ